MGKLGIVWDAYTITCVIMWTAMMGKLGIAWDAYTIICVI